MKSLNRTQICTKCELEKQLIDFYYHRNRKEFMKSCKTCNEKRSCEYQKEKRNQKDINFLFRARANGIKRDKKGVCPVMDKLGVYLIELWKSQQGRCYYTNVQMDISGYAKNNHLAVTVDRIIPELGYIENNIALCCSIVNRMKQDLKVEELKDWCVKLLQFCNTSKELIV